MPAWLRVVAVDPLEDGSVVVRGDGVAARDGEVNPRVVADRCLKASGPAGDG